MHSKYSILIFLLLTLGCSDEKKDQLLEELNSEYETLSREIDNEINELNVDLESLEDLARDEIESSVRELKEQKRELQKEILKTKVLTWIEMQEVKGDLRKFKKEVRKELKQIKSKIEKSRK